MVGGALDEWFRRRLTSKDLRPILDAVLTRMDRRRLLLVGGIQAIDALLLLVLPWMVGRLADGLFGEAQGVSIGWVAVALFLLAAVRTGASVAASLLSGSASMALALSLQEWLLRRVLQLDYQFYLRRKTGDLLSAVVRDTDAVADFVGMVVPALLPNLVLLVGTVVILASIAPALAIGMLPAIAIAVLLLRLWTRRNRPLSKRLQDAYADTTASAEAALDMLPALRWLDAERHAHEDFAEANKRLAVLAGEWRQRAVPVQPAVHLVAFGVALLVLALVGGKSAGESPGTLVSLLLYAGVAARPLASFAAQFGQFNAAIGAADRMAELIAAPAESRSGRDLPSGTACVVAFQRVSFAWRDREPIIRDIDGSFPAGSWVVVAGPNGSGKSTLLQLIGRLVRPASGRITIGGVDLASLSASALRGAIAAVPQQAWLLHGTIEANLRLARPAATSEELALACRLADLDSLLAVLPCGLDTVIGPHGLRLSGGQQQRLMIARAVLRDAPIILLDEATSMFDLEAQRAFFDRARTALAGRTVIFVSHDPELLRFADLVIDMPGGTIRAGNGTGRWDGESERVRGR